MAPFAPLQDEVTAPYHRCSTPCVLGESPIYNVTDNTLHWVDFFSSPPTLHILQDTNQEIYRVVELPVIITCIYFTAPTAATTIPGTYSYIAGFPKGIGSLTVHENGSVEWKVIKELLSTEDFDAGKLMVNDGNVDPAGRLWINSADLVVMLDSATGGAGNLPKPIDGAGGKLWRFDGKDVVEMDKNVVVGNGICWSPDTKSSKCNSDFIPGMII
jgi:sugar lactone lactonase YvrE